MFENDNEQDANLPQEPSAPEQSPSEGEPQSGSPENEQSQPAAQPESVPFHEHPRWKEVIEERKQYKEQLDEQRRLTQQLAEKLEQFEKSNPPQIQKDELLEQIRAVNPQFAERFEQMQQRLSSLDSVEEKIQQYEQSQKQQAIEQQRNLVQKQIADLHSEYKVPENLRERYQREVTAIAMNDPSLRIEDLPKVYKAVHEDYSKFLEGFKRETTQSYAQSKQKDAVPPTSSKSASASKSTSNPKGVVDRDEMLKSIVDNALHRRRAQQDV